MRSEEEKFRAVTFLREEVTTGRKGSLEGTVDIRAPAKNTGKYRTKTATPVLLGRFRYRSPSVLHHSFRDGSSVLSD